MKVLTLKQPWAWAILHAGKDVENRVQAFTHRGDLGIHAGLSWDPRGAANQMIRRAVWDAYGTTAPLDNHRAWSAVWHHGEIVGSVTLTDVHHANPRCCASPWAERHGDRITHLCVTDPTVYATPIPAQGMLGLWTYEPETP